MKRLVKNTVACDRSICYCKKTLDQVKNIKLVQNYWSDYVKCITKRKEAQRKELYRVPEAFYKPSSE